MSQTSFANLQRFYTHFSTFTKYGLLQNSHLIFNWKCFVRKVKFSLFIQNSQSLIIWGLPAWIFHRRSASKASVAQRKAHVVWRPMASCTKLPAEVLKQYKRRSNYPQRYHSVLKFPKEHTTPLNSSSKSFKIRFKKFEIDHRSPNYVDFELSYGCSRNAFAMEYLS